MKSIVDRGIPVGVLCYHQGKAIAWCSIAPRDTYRPLGGSERESPLEQIWSLVCFFIKRDYRNQGVTRKLISAAIDHASGPGATVIEAYPVDPDSPSYRFRGFVGVFAAAKFEEVGRAGRRRHVMRFTIPPRADAKQV